MDYKKVIKDDFSNDELILELRYKYSKRAFIIMCFLFFCNFFFVWARFFDWFFTQTLSIFYYMFLVSFLFFLFFYSKITFKIKWLYQNILIWILALMFLVFIIPFLWFKF